MEGLSDSGCTRVAQDHGEVAGEQPGVWWKSNWFEQGCGIPFIARWPGVIAPGRTEAGLVSLTDIGATAVRLEKQSLYGFNVVSKSALSGRRSRLRAPRNCLAPTATRSSGASAARVRSVERSCAASSGRSRRGRRRMTARPRSRRRGWFGGAASSSTVRATEPPAATSLWDSSFSVAGGRVRH